MSNKTIEITAMSAREVNESLDLNDTVLISDTIEDLADVIQYLGSRDDPPTGGIAAVAFAQKLLIEICRIPKKDAPDINVESKL